MNISVAQNGKLHFFPPNIMQEINGFIIWIRLFCIAPIELVTSQMYILMHKSHKSWLVSLMTFLPDSTPRLPRSDSVTGTSLAVRH